LSPFLFRLVVHPASLRVAEPEPQGVNIRSYRKELHHRAVRNVYAAAFDDEPWSADWDNFDQFDPKGAFIAEESGSGNPVGFCLSFSRGEYGYISVVAVVPAFRRRGVASALVGAACDYLSSLGHTLVKVDAYIDSLPAVNLYRHLGFTVESSFEDSR